MSEKTWTVHFRIVKPEDYMTPYTYLPMETIGGIEAEDKDGVMPEFCRRYKINQEDLRNISIEED